VFSWVRTDGAESCPGRTALATDVTRRLGYDAFREPYGQSLEGVVSRTERGWTVHLYNRGSDGTTLGQRTLESEEAECEALTDAVALAMALVVDPEAALRAPTPDAATAPDALPPTEAPEPVSEPAVDAPTAPAAEEPPARAAVRLGVGAAGSYDMIPGLGAAARLSVDGPILPELRWFGAVSFWPEQVATHNTASFGIGLTAFSLGLCAGAGFDGFRFDGCATLDVGAVHVVVHSPTPLAPGQRLHVGATALLRLEARIVDPLWVGFFGGIAVPFVRYQYRVQGHREVVFEPSAVSPVLGIDLAVRFR